MSESEDTVICSYLYFYYLLQTVQKGNQQVVQQSQQEQISYNSPLKLNQKQEDDDKLFYANSNSLNNKNLLAKKKMSSTQQHKRPHINSNIADSSDQFDSQNMDNACQNVSNNNQIHNVSHLSRVRVIKKNLVYVIGIAPQLANEQILQSYQYFGQYGNIQKIVVNKNNIYNPKGPNGPSYSAYITYTEEKEASLSILGAENFKIFDRIIRASYGTTKYCSFFLKNLDCPNIPDCLYLHSYEKDDDYFSKDEMVSNKNIFIDQQKIAIKHVKKYIPEILSEYQQNKSFYESQSHIFALPNLSKIIDKLKEYSAITNEQYLACREYQQIPNTFVLSQFLPNVINQHGLNNSYSSFIAQNTVVPQQPKYDYDFKVQQSSYFNPFSQNQESLTTTTSSCFNRQQFYYQKKNNFLSQSAMSINQGIYSNATQNQSHFSYYYPSSPPIKTQYFTAQQSQSEYLNTKYCQYELVNQTPQVTPFEINDQQSKQDSAQQKIIQQKFDNFPHPHHNNFNIYQQNNDNLKFVQPNDDKSNFRLQQDNSNMSKQEFSKLNYSYEKDKIAELTSEDTTQVSMECSQADNNCASQNQEKNFKSEIESYSNNQYSTLTETNKELTDTQSQYSIEDDLNAIQSETLQIQNSKEDYFHKMLNKKKSLNQIQSQVAHLSKKSSHSIKSNYSLGESNEEETNKIQEIQLNQKCECDSLPVKGEGNSISQNKFDSGSKTINQNYELIANFWDEQNYKNKQQQILLKQQNNCLGQESENEKHQLLEQKIIQDQQNQEKNPFYYYESEQNSFQELCSGFNTFVLTKFY
ncbi:RNA recognition motif protein (macronuclear) [Tetrahymena thermophila SB210]|uniref:RNA recognition motif protein n=1 Tax=Tetrahymena thermophila (strain SB210) TaxID=312017 RepID=I7MGT4_TETTS|nr:RNA recognition motif protein [Tetrahymena thermophila SB210]EAS02027.2 RNA recognition motif protein [Tetrahymena thermophila SB210]|eukprot:XP_001022272.2 RNA recognition motif protein [Tetrahymena thermophila SB210]